MANVTLPKGVSAPKSGENTWLWLWKLASGPLIFILILIHFAVNHYLGSNGLLSYREVLSYYSNSIVPVMEGIFLVVVVSHSLLGLRSVILDLHPSRSLLRAIDWIFLLGGTAAVVYGIWLLNVIVASIPKG
ncbi:MAG TPA: hypothetical protein VMT46_00115 [Anaerolineaceae bacterium]|nr:hypothetical protein [Anaerolineaceae bacterium]